MDDLELLVERHVPKLTGPELDALRWAAAGLTAAMTARVFCKSRDTVSNQLDSARLKLAAKTKTQAVARAMRHGLIP